MRFIVEAFDPSSRSLTQSTVDAADPLDARRQIESRGLEVRNLSEVRPPAPQGARLALVALACLAAGGLSLGISAGASRGGGGTRLVYALQALIGVLGAGAVFVIGQRRVTAGLVSAAVVFVAALMVASHAVQTMQRSQPRFALAAKPAFTAMIDPTVAAGSVDLLSLAGLAAAMPLAISMIRPRKGR